jgi:hypothetical protein
VSLIKKADVQDHLSARRRKTVFPFGLAGKSNVIRNSGTELPSEVRHDSGPEPLSKISPIDVLTGPGRPTTPPVIEKPQA